MGKVLKVAALIVVAAAIIVFAAPIAGVLTGLGATILGSAAFSVSIAAVVAVGASLALTAVGTLFRKAPSLSSAMADRLSAQVNPTAPRKIVFGRTAAGNDVRFYETYGSKKDKYAQVIALASHKLNAIRSLYLDADLTWQDGSIVAHANGFNGIRMITEGSSANAFVWGSGTYWSRSASFTGCAYMALDFVIDTQKIWTKGIPTKMTTLVEGCPVYDPRLDSTTGGNGSHRFGDQSTYEWSHNGIEIGRNPALCLLTYLAGWKINGKSAWGMGVPAYRINFDNFRTYANVCEETVQTQGGGGVQRYTCDGVFSTADTHESVIGGITAAMGSCKLSDVGGSYGLIGGYDDTLGPKQAFTADDLMGGVSSPAPYTWVPAGPARETYNIVRGRYADPNQQYQLAEWGVVETDPLPDGINRTLTLDLGCVSRPETAQRIAKQFLMREAKTPGFFSATFGPLGYTVQVGSLVTLSLQAQGWNNKLFRVQDQHETPDMFYQMLLREESPEVYGWDREEKPIPAQIRPGGYDASMTITPTGLTLDSDTYQTT